MMIQFALLLMTLATPAQAFDQTCKNFADTFLRTQGLGTYGHPNRYVARSKFSGASEGQSNFDVTSQTGHRFLGKHETLENGAKRYKVTIKDFGANPGSETPVSYSRKDCGTFALIDKKGSRRSRLCRSAYTNYFKEVLIDLTDDELRNYKYKAPQ